MKRILLLFIISLTLSCSKDAVTPSTSDCQTNQSLRKGCVCKDGTQSSATGSGACSGHSGVDHWICR